MGKYTREASKKRRIASNDRLSKLGIYNGQMALKSIAQRVLDGVKEARKGKKYKCVKISNKTWKEVEIFDDTE